MNVFPGHPKRNGFTLVEMLTVIVIIGILAGIAIPAITSALRTAKEAAIRAEINVMSQALESYKLEHGDYPPDFSDWDAVERHFRNAFPNIDNNELRILSQFTHYNSMMERTGEAGGAPPADPRTSAAFDHYPHAIDRAEALVFCLGGLSRDKKRPFTGQGGPLVKISTAPAAEPNGDANDYTFFQYNSDRDTGFFELKPPQLAIELITVPATFAYSNDEKAAIGSTSTNDLGFIFHPDPFPTYRPSSSERPIVYFNSKSYDQAWGEVKSAAWDASKSHHFQNVYLPTGTISDTGIARPYASNVVDTTPPGTINGIPVTGTVLEFAENNKFQLISSGLDNNYGGIISLTGSQDLSAGIGVYPSGQYYNPFRSGPFSPAGPYPTVSSVDKFQDDQCLKVHYGAGSETYRSQPQIDNITNFTTRTLESDLP